ncbi:MAG: class I SAM-dependent methyltransferase [Candidatus Tectomicrobia bacterium]|uniref:Class I SAM-dependent methyltransferase n=1 Tax=Tectimicrobiota bacterium TaxID=2528274 RepID=A0A932ZVT9_UNCTE|nr:class I SAM-dependent methyltransferase [Candidatus Tectomicrobia bacterium]
MDAIHDIPGTTAKKELARKYDAFARRYDLAEAMPELLGLRKLRRRLLNLSRGKVLEVAAGTGKNLRYYPRGCRLTCIDMSPAMLALARKRAAKSRPDVFFSVMDGERLAFPDRCFDTVVDSLTLCTFPDPVGALREMVRVCRDEGRILLIEHGRSDRAWLGNWQDRRAERHAVRLGCRWNRDPLSLARQAGLRILSARRVFFGIFHEIEATPYRGRTAAR